MNKDDIVKLIPVGRVGDGRNLGPVASLKMAVLMASNERWDEELDDLVPVDWDELYETELKDAIAEAVATEDDILRVRSLDGAKFEKHSYFNGNECPVCGAMVKKFLQYGDGSKKMPSYCPGCGHGIEGHKDKDSRNIVLNIRTIPEVV